MDSNKYTLSGVAVEYPIPLRRKLQMQRDELQNRINDLDAALTVLDKSPDFQEIIDTLSKVTRL